MRPHGVQCVFVIAPVWDDSIRAGACSVVYCTVLCARASEAVPIYPLPWTHRGFTLAPSVLTAVDGRVFPPETGKAEFPCSLFKDFLKIINEPKRQCMNMLRCSFVFLLGMFAACFPILFYQYRTLFECYGVV